MAGKRRPTHRFWLVLCLLALVIGFFGWSFTGLSLIPHRAADSDLIVDKNGVNILLIGSDENAAYHISGRADAIMVAHADLKAGTLFLLSVPRDTLADIDGYGQDKLNHAYAYGGEELLAQTLQAQLRIPIDYYVAVDFSGFTQVVDLLGGVTIDVDQRMYFQTYDGLIDIEAGVQRLNGEQALQYVRFRQDESGDITRVSRQQNFLKSLLEQSRGSLSFWQLPQLMRAVDEMTVSDLGKRGFFRLAIAYRSLTPDQLSGAMLPGAFTVINGVGYWQTDAAAAQEFLETYFSDRDQR